MLPADVRKVLQVLEVMGQYELNLSAFYDACAEAWKAESAFWSELAQAERTHAANIQKLSEILAKKPERFTLARPFNTIVLNTAIAGIKNNIAQLKAGTLNEFKALILARDIEQSILESKYAEIVKTQDMEYQTLMGDIVNQTNTHKNTIQKKLENATAS